MRDYFAENLNLPTSILEPSAGKGDFIIEAWNTAVTQLDLNKKSIEQLVSRTILFENDENIFQDLKKNIARWCKENKIISKPILIKDNFLLNEGKYKLTYGKEPLVIGNPPWDEFTTRKHDGHSEEMRTERAQEKELYKNSGFKNVYQCFLQKVLEIKSENLKLIFILPRQLLGDQSSTKLRESLIQSGLLRLNVYANKDYPEFYFEAVAGTAEILCLNYTRSQKTGVEIRRNFTDKFQTIKPFGDDYTIPCPHISQSGAMLKKILSHSPLLSWNSDWSIKIKRGDVDYTDVNYKNAIGGRDFSAYQFEYSTDKKATPVIVLNKILPDSRRKIKAAILKKNFNISDSLITISTGDKSLYPYLMLILNSRPIELVVRSLTSNINLNNYRLLSLPIPEPTDEMLQLAQKLCNECESGKISWDYASDLLTKKAYALDQKDLITLKNFYPDRKSSILELVA